MIKSDFTVHFLNRFSGSVCRKKAAVLCQLLHSQLQNKEIKCIICRAILADLAPIQLMKSWIIQGMDNINKNVTRQLMMIKEEDIDCCEKEKGC